MKLGFIGTFPARATAAMSGPRRVCLNLAKALISTAGGQVDILAYGQVGTGLGQKIVGRPVVSQHLGLRVAKMGYLVLPFFVRRYDVLYFAGGPFHAVLPVLLSRIVRYPPIVYCAHGIIRQERRLHADEESRAPLWREWLEGIVLKHCDRVVCASPVCVDMAVGEWGIEKSKTWVVPHGVGDTFEAKIGKSNPASSPLRIVTISKVHRCKGLEFLVEALKRLRGVDFELYVISTGGSAVYRCHLESLAANANGGLPGNIHFVGPCDAQELREHFAAASIYVQASRHETFCLAVLEAMSAGLPVVVTKTTGMSYLLKNGENGFVVPFGDAEVLAERLRTLLQDASLRKQISTANIARARELSWDASAKLLLQHFAALGIK